MRNVFGRQGTRLLTIALIASDQLGLYPSLDFWDTARPVRLYLDARVILL